MTENGDSAGDAKRHPTAAVIVDKQPHCGAEDAEEEALLLEMRELEMEMRRGIRELADGVGAPAASDTTDWSRVSNGSTGVADCVCTWV